MIHVVNKRTFKTPAAGTAVVFYIGRGSPLGNRYSHKKGTKAEFIVATREEAIEECRFNLLQRIKEKDEATCNALNEIFQAADKGDVYLMCYCKPLPCHGDIIKAIIEGAFELRNKK